VHRCGTFVAAGARPTRRNAGKRVAFSGAAGLGFSLTCDPWADPRICIVGARGRYRTIQQGEDLLS